ncbi:TetR/AcrR family transcriptional regulator [Aldersonia kunmingensis]|uniref:TetR/AcrR family transcriptional regulator n=1 Tax=Aldersonia kunmingensis TaxID=408066 RepID=UPI00082E9AA0|nr:TetR/AcrR family transcriptional regulator [Aldersonia kunmingensis]
MRSRKKIINATLSVIESAGFNGVSIAAVAEAAKVSRQTVYSNFGSREDLVSQALSELMVDILGDIRARAAAAKSPFEYVRELIVAGRLEVRTHAVLGRLLEVARDNPVFDSDVMERAKPLSQLLLAPLVEEYPDIEPRLEEIGLVATRWSMSIILFDDESVRTDDDLRDFLGRWLRPAME